MSIIIVLLVLMAIVIPYLPEILKVVNHLLVQWNIVSTGLGNVKDGVMSVYSYFPVELRTLLVFVLLTSILFIFIGRGR